MGKVELEIELVNAGDDALHRRGFLASDEIRRLTTTAWVGTGEKDFAISKEAIKKLGLRVIEEGTSHVKDDRGVRRKVYGSVLINVMGRSSISWVVESPPNVPALLGQVPLELMDLMVDLRNQKLVPGHPESPDMAVWESY